MKSSSATFWAPDTPWPHRSANSAHEQHTALCSSVIESKLLTITILVKQGEGLFELGDLLVS